MNGFLSFDKSHTQSHESLDRDKHILQFTKSSDRRIHLEWRKKTGTQKPIDNRRMMSPRNFQHIRYIAARIQTAVVTASAQAHKLIFHTFVSQNSLRFTLFMTVRLRRLTWPHQKTHSNRSSTPTSLDDHLIVATVRTCTAHEKKKTVASEESPFIFMSTN